MNFIIVLGMLACSSFLISVCMFIVSKVFFMYFLCCSVNGSVCLVCCVSDSVCELFGETIRNIFGVVVMLNVMEVLSVGGGALLDRPCMVFQCMCADCPADPYERSRIKVGLQI